MPNVILFVRTHRGRVRTFQSTLYVDSISVLSVFGQLVEGDVDQADIEPQVGVRQNSS